MIKMVKKVFLEKLHSKRVSSPQMWGSLFDDFFERSESGVEKGYRQLGRLLLFLGKNSKN
jgi:hypothetical protein